MVRLQLGKLEYISTNILSSTITRSDITCLIQSTDPRNLFKNYLEFKKMEHERNSLTCRHKITLDRLTCFLKSINQ